MAYIHGIKSNRAQFAHQLLQVLFVGLALGLMRTVVPALAESEFGVPRGSFLLLTTFVIAFGLVKAVLNFVAGAASERIGRRQVLLLGWWVAVPIPFLLYYAPDWGWVVAATVLLGVNQGMTWSATQTSKIDLSHNKERGLALGLDEFAGYIGVALGGVVTGYLAISLGTRMSLLVFGLVVIALAIVSAVMWVQESLPWAHAENPRPADALADHPCFATPVPVDRGTARLAAYLSFRNRCFLAYNQAGHVEKFVDALVWIFYPVFLYERGLTLPQIGWVVGVYGFVWGGSQLVTGKLSDHIGRKTPIVGGMWLCGAGVALMLLGDGIAWWSFAAAVTGLGMALLYPNLGAAISDLAHPTWRGTAIGVYRFWRDLGYGVGAALLGLVASLSGDMTAGFWFVAAAMAVSGAVTLAVARERVMHAKIG